MTERGNKRFRTLTLLTVLGGVLVWVALSPPGANDLVGGDEGYYGTMARNVVDDAGYLLSTSQTPLGPPGDKPPVYPGILAISIAALGPGEAAVRIPSLIMAALIVLATALLVARCVGPGWGTLSVALLMTLPWFANTSRIATAEIPLSLFSLAGLVVLTGGRRTPAHLLLAGALFGLAFLCKLWLVVLIGIPALAYLWPWAQKKGADALLFLAGAAIVGSLQLVTLAIANPGLLGHWWNIYLGFSLSTRLAGEGYADYWIKSPWYYWFILTHAYVLLLPLVALGFEYTVRRLREPLPRLLFFWGAGIVILSLFRVKSGIYLYPLVPAWAALAVTGAYSLTQRESRVGPITLFFFLFSAPPLADLLGERGAPIGLWVVIWIIGFAAIALSARRTGFTRYLAILMVAMATLGGFTRNLQRLPTRYHDLGYREVAEALAPQFEHVDPARLSLIAPEAPAFNYYLFRTAGYWGTPITPWSADRAREVQQDEGIRAFVIDPSRVEYGGWPDEATVDWLEESTREITSEIEATSGREIRVRVFVRSEP